MDSQYGTEGVVDEISGWLTLYDDGSVDRTWSGAPRFKFLAEAVPPHNDFINGVATRDIVIDRNTDLSVRLYLPETTNTTNLPIILHLYGGGFCIGSPDWFMYYNIYTRIARACGAIVVSPYLRRAPEHRLPAAIDDAYSTLLWLKALANKESHEPWVVSARGDFNRVFLIGDSSGGNLVHQVARKAAQENPDPLRVAGVVPIHPGFVRSVRSKSELEAPESTFLTLHMLDKFMELGLPEGSTKDHPITCPMAEQVDNLDLPPYLLYVAEKDLILDTEIEFYETMKKANKKIELLMSYGMGHIFYLNKIDIDNDPQTADETEKFVQGIANFVKSH